jgi:hypothetical protein
MTPEAWFREVLSAHADVVAALKVCDLTHQAWLEATPTSEACRSKEGQQAKRVCEAARKLYEQARERLNAALLKAPKEGE